MANIKLNFFGKDGNPLNFDYIGPTGPTLADSKFTYRTKNSTPSDDGDIIVSFTSNDVSFYFYKKDLNGFDLDGWYSEIVSFINQGSTVYLGGEVSGQKGFRLKIRDIIKTSGNDYVVNGFIHDYDGQTLISPDSQIYFNTTYENRPGGYFKGNIYFEPVSAGLYENEQIFIVQEFDTPEGYQYGLPHTGSTGSTGSGRWRTRWYNDNYGESDVTDIIFTYTIENQLSGGNGEPLIVNYPNMVIPVDYDPSDEYKNGYVYTSSVSSEEIGRAHV